MTAGKLALVGRDVLGGVASASGPARLGVPKGLARRVRDITWCASRRRRRYELRRGSGATSEGCLSAHRDEDGHAGARSGSTRGESW